MLDRIVIVGAGRTTQSLLALLANLAPILVLDTVAVALEEIAEAAPATRTVHLAQAPAHAPAST